MPKKRMMLGIIAIIGVIAITVGALITRPWTYFITNEVDEAFPTLTTDTTASQVEGSTTVITTDETPEPAEPAEPQTLLMGSFIEIDAIHSGSGSAVVYQLEDDSRIVRFEDFQVTNGPELHVILSKEVPTSTLGSIGEDYIDLGELKGNVGNQNYTIPASVDLSEYKSVVIYCVPFSVVFSSAALG